MPAPSSSHPSGDAFAIEVDASTRVSARLVLPTSSSACFVFAHGAGAGMDHAFMAAFADGLAARSVATLRYQFPFVEAGRRRPDRPALAQATVRAAVAEAGRRCAGLPLFAGGKSFGGRMTSQAQATQPLADVIGLVFVGFPLHPAGRPGTERATHLADVACPMLFLQGTRDDLADAGLVDGVVAGLGPRATLVSVDDADHAFHVRRSTGRTDAQVRDALLDATAAWMTARAVSVEIGSPRSS